MNSVQRKFSLPTFLGHQSFLFILLKSHPKINMILPCAYPTAAASLPPGRRPYAPMGRRPRRRIVFLRAGFLLVEFSKSIQLGERPTRRSWLCLPSEIHSPFHRGGQYQNRRRSLNYTVSCLRKHPLSLQQTTNNKQQTTNN